MIPFFSPLATSATDLIIPIGLLLYVIFTQLAIFFVFLWKGGTGKIGSVTISLSSGLGLVMSVLSLTIGVTPQPIMWVYDNQTIVFVSQFMIPQAQAVDEYYAVFVFEIFLLIVSVIKIMFESGIMAPEGGEE